MSVSIKDVNKEPEEDYSEFLNKEENLGATIGDLLKPRIINKLKPYSLCSMAFAL